MTTAFRSAPGAARIPAPGAALNPAPGLARGTAPHPLAALRRERLRAAVAVMWSVLLLLGGAAAGARQGDPALEVSSPWVRAMPPGQRMTAAYLTLRNRSGEALRITGVSSPAGAASLHETRVVDGRSSMRPVEALEVPAGGSAVFEPGGLHIMLMGLAQTPAEGSSVELCLETSAGASCFAAPVQRAAGAMQHGHEKH